jgi:tRNA dimethylallyltransferase
MNKIKVIVLLGQTAVGKSSLALNLAKQINGEIISADSMQVYKGMDIGTAKPTKLEQKEIKHHLIDMVNPDEEWNLSKFIEKFHIAITNIAKKGKTPIIVGGTGLYLWGLTKGLSLPLGKPDYALREKLEQENSASLYQQLKVVDPKAADKIHANDKKRIIRALEVCLSTHKPISQQQNMFSSEQFNFILIGLKMERDKLYKIIEQRVDQMIKNGLIEEVKNLLEKGYSGSLPSFQALGYKETIKYLKGETTKQEMIAEIKKRTRNFARRQMTWYRRFDNIAWIDAGPNINLNEITSLL